jgi:outer membrane biosynthesis protein TonB
MPAPRVSLVVSVTLHGAILLWGLIEFSWHKESSLPKSIAIPIDLVTSAELTKLKAGERQAKQEGLGAKPKQKKTEAKVSKPAPKPKPRKAVAKKPPPAKPKPKAEPGPAIKKAKAAKPKPKKRTKPKTTARAPKTKPAKSNADKIAALLNKIPDAAPESAPAPARQPDQVGRGNRQGQDLKMTRSEIDALRARIAQCWNPPVAGVGVAGFTVKLRLQLNQDGSLTQAPQIMNSGNSPIYRAAADSAVRAVWQCQPYQLSPAKYGQWRDMVLNFDPREMLGG